MKLPPHPLPARFPGGATLRTTPKSLLALILSIACVLSLGVDVPALSAAAPSDKSKKNKQDPTLKGLPITELNADEAVLHALNRLAYGPRPGDVERVKQMGLAKWIDQQLNPNSIDDRALQARLENYPTLAMSTTKLIEEYPQPKQAEKQAAKLQAQNGQPSAFGCGGRGDRQRWAGRGTSENTAGVAPAKEQDRLGAANNPTGANSSGAISAAPSPMKEDPAVAADSANVATRGVGGKKNPLSGADPNAVPKAIADDSKKPQRVVEELAMAKVTRAIYSERQLQQVLDDFWFNHFNVFAG